MKVRIVLFEDQQLCRMRPLSWSVPVWDLPVGMYSLRERMEILTGDAGGILLARPALAQLIDGDPWRTEWKMTAPDGHDLWLSGRLGARWEVLQGLLDAAGSGREFVWLYKGCPVAANLGWETSSAVHESWRTWLVSCRDGMWRGRHLLDPWDIEDLFSGWERGRRSGDHQLLVNPRGDHGDGADPTGRWRSWPDMAYSTLDAVWDLVPATEPAITEDIERTAELERGRFPLGISARSGDPLWERATNLSPLGGTLPGGVWILGDPQQVFLGPRVSLEPGTVIDTSRGPVILDHGVQVQASCRLEGPLYLGRGCRVKSGARLYGGCAFGIGCRVAGEIGETVAMHFVNKQHDGFIGHAVLGSWINLGAMTTCSDLKNNYGPVRVDLGWGPLETGSRFVGLLAAEHVKTAIGTLLNTGTCIGFASNIFGAGMPPKHVPCFAWGGQDAGAGHDVERALATAAVVMDRRGCRLLGGHETLFRLIASGSGQSP